jgi:tetracycline 7-halogenase / FADH2 O2-dependent halogenase
VVKVSNGSNEVAILGTEIAGIVLATILARHGLKVLMIDSGSHPRFAVGEATTPQMTSLLKLLAVRYLRHDDLH